MKSKSKNILIGLLIITTLLFLITNVLFIYYYAVPLKEEINFNYQYNEYLSYECEINNLMIEYLLNMYSQEDVTGSFLINIETLEKEQIILLKDILNRYEYYLKNGLFEVYTYDSINNLLNVSEQRLNSFNIE